MKSNLEKYKAQLKTLEDKGRLLIDAMQLECHPEEFEKEFKKILKDKYKDYLKKIPTFSTDYQNWYSEAHAVIKQLIPDRLVDFVRFYEKPKTRKDKDISCGNYVIEDYLLGLIARDVFSNEVKVGPYAAIPQFKQQLAILKSANQRFDSSLFDIMQLVQADLLDSELESARLLQKNKFFRAAGAIAGVVIEKHLAQICANHNITVSKKNPTIADFNDLLKSSTVTEIAMWRFIQHLADLRNLCDHNKEKEPSNENIDDLISGTEKITKTIF